MTRSSAPSSSAVRLLVAFWTALLLGLPMPSALLAQSIATYGDLATDGPHATIPASASYIRESPGSSVGANQAADIESAPTVIEGQPAEAASYFQPESQPVPGDATLAQGETAFVNSCTACHEAERALDQQKDYQAWLATVRRMTTKEGAAIHPLDVHPIAAYLASLAPGVAHEGRAGRSALGDVSVYATISPVWRGGSDSAIVEKPGFFVDAWIGAEWQPRGALRATVTACTSCHSDRNSSAGFSIELVEASATVNLFDLITGETKSESGCHRLVDVEVKAGRFIVPFGGFASMAHPGVLRTIGAPLMFNMGRRVGSVGPLQPVLPGPYTDEGVNLHGTLALIGETTVALDVFAVNGLQEGGASIFNASRRYYDNNREPAVGGRMTAGNSHFRLGASLMSGTLHDDGAPQLDYHLASADATWRYQDRLRAYFEYAIRSDDSVFVAGGRNHTYGWVIEMEYSLPHHSPLSLLARYDTLEQRDVFFGTESTERFTWGVNYLLPGGSRLMVNHEHWMFGAQPDDSDVLGVRWTTTF